jgi:hypothetical protein
LATGVTDGDGGLWKKQAGRIKFSKENRYLLFIGKNLKAEQKIESIPA